MSDIQIKFRGKSLSTGEWVYGSYLELEVQSVKHARIIPIFDQKEEVLDGTIDIDCIAVDPQTVGHYTGLEDENGIEIFTGDILQIWNYNHTSVVNQYAGEAYYDPYEGAYHLRNRAGKRQTISSFAIYCRPGSIQNIEIIGSIHDHPDLLIPTK